MLDEASDELEMIQGKWGSAICRRHADTDRTLPPSETLGSTRSRRVSSDSADSKRRAGLDLMGICLTKIERRLRGSESALEGHTTPRWYPFVQWFTTISRVTPACLAISMKRNGDFPLPVKWTLIVTGRVKTYH